MLESVLSEKVQKATTLHNVDDFPSRPQYIGGWHLHNVAQAPKEVEFWITAAVYQEDQETLIFNWPKKEDPYTQADLLEGEDNQVQELIYQIRTSIIIPNHENMANRLHVLYNAAKEEDSTNPGITVNSLRNFYDFLLLNTNLKCPIITLTPDNNIYASWRGEHGRLFSVHFLPNGETNFVIFKPNYRHPERQIRISGNATYDLLMETVAPNGVNDWISD